MAENLSETKKKILKFISEYPFKQAAMKVIARECGLTIYDVSYHFLALKEKNKVDIFLHGRLKIVSLK